MRGVISLVLDRFLLVPNSGMAEKKAMPFFYGLLVIAFSFCAEAASDPKNSKSGKNPACDPDTLRVLVKKIAVPVTAASQRTEAIFKGIRTDLKIKQSALGSNAGLRAIEVIPHPLFGELILFSVGEHDKAPTWHLYETTGGLIMATHTPALVHAEPHATLPLHAHGEGGATLVEKAIAEFQTKNSPDDVRRFHDRDAAKRILTSTTGVPGELRELSLLLPNGETAATILLPDDVNEARFLRENSTILVSEGKTRAEGGWTDANFRVYDAVDLQEISPTKTWKTLTQDPWSRIEQVEAQDKTGVVYIVGQKTGETSRNDTRKLYSFLPGHPEGPQAMTGVPNTTLAEIKRVDRVMRVPGSEDLLIFGKTDLGGQGSVLFRYSPSRQSVRWHRHIALENALESARDIQISPDGKRIIVRDLEAMRSGVLDLAVGHTLQMLPSLPPQRIYDFRWAGGGERILWIQGRELQMWTWHEPAGPARAK